jgi:pyocin large subunit-like protein
MANVGKVAVTSIGTNTLLKVAAKEGVMAGETQVARQITKTVGNNAKAGTQKAAQFGEKYFAKEELNAGKQIWSSTKNKTSVQNAFGHWKDHKNEFPELLNVKQYVERCRNLIQNSEGTLTKIRPNGEILRYHLNSNTFGAFTKEGVPKTMFRPRESLRYWESRN